MRKMMILINKLQLKSFLLIMVQLLKKNIFSQIYKTTCIIEWPLLHLKMNPQVDLAIVE